MPSRHELSDANALKIMLVAIVFILGSMVMLLGLGATFYILKSYVESETLPTALRAMILKRQVPPPPLLEINPAAENESVLAKERQMLNSYQWIDQKKGILRIPIEQAIEILLYEH
jgi:hypothetical protein